MISELTSLFAVIIAALALIMSIHWHLRGSVHDEIKTCGKNIDRLEKCFKRRLDELATELGDLRERVSGMERDINWLKENR